MTQPQLQQWACPQCGKYVFDAAQKPCCEIQLWCKRCHKTFSSLDVVPLILDNKRETERNCQAAAMLS